jgi:hypothetical protein
MKVRWVTLNDRSPSDILFTATKTLNRSIIILTADTESILLHLSLLCKEKVCLLRRVDQHVLLTDSLQNDRMYRIYSSSPRQLSDVLAELRGLSYLGNGCPRRTY